VRTWHLRGVLAKVKKTSQAINLLRIIVEKLEESLHTF